MDDNAAKVIVAALERQAMPPPGTGRLCAFFNAVPLPGAPEEWVAGLVCEQGFRPLFLRLRDAGYRVEPLLAQAWPGIDAAIVLAGRLRAASEQAVARAWAMLPEGAPILVCGANTDGIKSLRKWVAAHAAVEDSFSKHHAVCFVLRRGAAGRFPAPPLEGAQILSPTMFSAGAVDAGSRLLAGFFDGRIAGDVADFGAGSGYLSGEVLRQPGVTRLDLCEADYLSLERAKTALAGAAVETGFFWLDLLREAPPARYDWIVMNPPFHSGRAAEPAIGIGFIAAAARALKPRGRLLMVANRQLPYEAALKERFARASSLAEEAGYKVIEAQAG